MRRGLKMLVQKKASHMQGQNTVQTGGGLRQVPDKGFVVCCTCGGHCCDRETDVDTLRNMCRGALREREAAQQEACAAERRATQLQRDVEVLGARSFRCADNERRPMLSPLYPYGLFCMYKGNVLRPRWGCFQMLLLLVSG